MIAHSIQVIGLYTKILVNIRLLTLENSTKYLRLIPCYLSSELALSIQHYSSHSDPVLGTAVRTEPL